MENEQKGISNVKLVIICIVLGIIVIILWARFISTKGLIVKEYPVYSSNLPNNFEGLKIVQFSDVLYGRTVNKDDIKKLVVKINELKPDIVVFTGDLIDKDTVYKKSLGDYLTAELTKIEARLDKFAVVGDYDKKLDDYEIIMKNAGFKFLNNEYRLIYDNGNTPILITGLPSLTGSSKNKQDIPAAFSYLTEHPDENNFTITLVHDGDTYEKIKDYNINLVLSGHSLNGQIRLPFVGALTSKKGSKKYYDNHYQVKNTDIFVSSGIGTTNYSFRWFNKPSINLYRLYQKN